MNERLLKILNEFGLTSSHLAEKLGVQRSNVSHVLSGRNKPGYEFIAALIKEFPTINPYWVINGDGPMYNSQKEKVIDKKTEQENATGLFNQGNDHHTGHLSGQKTETSESTIQSEDPGNKHISASESLGNSLKDRGDIDKIVFFYTNGTFDVYKS